ncbi:MAG: MBL fold metallo-hydrolase [Proteobacteria bacterium]|nr:MBL fold metallo-hydrolase [Pseudomonadota bacterium]
MSESHYYLKPNVLLEPLFAGWYAWPHLISPATAAMNVLHRHLTIMDSFIQAPHIHAAAVKNPRMLGGPFMDHPEDRVDEVAQLRDRTARDQAHLIEFARAVIELGRMLEERATGYSMEPLYQSVPGPLRGYVELLYDLDNQPSFRFFEPLLYRSRYYDRERQSIALSVIESDQRPFVLSTPKLDEPGTLMLEIPFEDPRIDDLFAMRYQAGDPEAVGESLDLGKNQFDVFRGFFTDQPPTAFQRYTGSGIRTRYFGHACVLVESRDVSILIDPVISYTYPADVSRFTYQELPETIDCVLITHNHQDHVLLETLLQLRHRIERVIIPRGGGGALQDPSLKLMLRAIGFAEVIELDEFDEIELPGCTITGVPFVGEHCDLDIRSKLCHHVRLAGRSILFAADSCNIEPRLYRYIHREIGDVDVLFVGMECDGAPLSWLYGPLLTEPLARDKDHSRRLAGSDFSRARDLVRQFNPSDVYVYAMGQEPWLTYIMSLTYTEFSKPIVASNQLLEYCRDEGIVAERLFGEKELIYG